MGEIYEAASYEPRKGVSYLISRVRSELLAAVDRELATDRDVSSLEVTAAQFVILANLATGGAKSASDLCKHISYDAGAMTRMIDRLEEKGLLRRSRDSEDRRLVNLELTETGLAAIPRMMEVSRRVANRFLEGFSKAESRQLEGLLTRMLENALRGV
jgi:MarR family transcriptional regulator, multiple antibiotic resistance protein MarR